MMNRCFLDVDGVLADFVGGVHRKLGIEFSYDAWPYKKGPEGWNFHDEIGITFEDLSELCDFEFWKNLEWTPDGHDILRVVLRYFDPNQITLLTSPMPNVMSASGKMAWIMDKLPAYKFRTGIWTDSKAILAGVPDSVLVDDHQKNTDVWQAGGGRAVLVPRPWNCLHRASLKPSEWIENEVQRYVSNACNR
jgi:5'(3')-deoxyribonucleotidase